jgi:O-antigen ligase
MRALNENSQDGRLAGWMLLALLTFVFILGGGSRGDIDSLILLRPVAFLCLGIGIFLLNRDAIAQFWPALALFGGLMVVAMIQLIPLPPSIWAALPGHQDFAEAAKLTGTADVWRPISLVPSMTKNSVLALLVPLAVSVLYCAAAPKFRKNAFWVIVIAAITSIVLGILQLAVDPQSPLFFYRITNNGSAVGLFANANHSAVFLAVAFPIIYYLIRQYPKISEGRQIAILVVLWVLFCAIVLAIGSRGGLALFLISSVLLICIIALKDVRKNDGKPKGKSVFNRILIFAPMVAVFLALSFYSANNLAFTDSVASLSEDMNDELRWELLPVLTTMVQDFFPFGAGGGTFPYIYYKYEPLELVSSSLYLNRAHSDFLEVVFEFGLFGLIIIALAAFGTIKYLWKNRRIKSSDQSLLLFVSVSGMAVLLAMSIFDYPLRTPSLACVFAILLLSIFRVGHKTEIEANRHQTNSRRNAR